MSNGLLTTLMLDEAYVIHVLGFDQQSLHEGRYNMRLQQDIFEAHLLAEGWFSNGVDWLKEKGVEGYEAVKDKAMEVPNAIKEFGSDIKGIVAALTAMVNDPEEAKAYKTGIFASIQTWPKSLLESLSGIEKWMEDHSMPSFAKGLRKIIDLLQGLWSKVSKMSGWVGSISMMSFGLAVRYIEEEFGILEKAKTVRGALKNPKKMVKSFAGDMKNVGENVMDDIKDFFAGETTDLAKDSDLYKKIAEFLKEKLAFVETIKNKFIDIGKQIAGQALQQFAGPVAWIKQLIELFQSSSWVISNLNKMLVSVKV
tara:strand:- start:3958 stop:4890 length:933 start_codon:yes stop_codon:yes gene_type:complete